MGQSDQQIVEQAGFTESQRIKLVVTSAQLLAGHVTPVPFGPPPPVGKAFVVKWCTMKYDFVTTAYTIGAGAKLQLRNVGVAAAVATSGQPTGLVDQAASTFVNTTPTVPTNIPVTDVAGIGLEFFVGVAALTLGDGTLTIEAEVSLVDAS